MKGIFLLIVILVLFIFVFGLVFGILYHASHQSKKLVRKCTQETTGTIEKFRLLDGGMRVIVRYTVNGNEYTVKENVGQYRIQNTDQTKRIREYRQYINGKPGDTTPVMYDPNKPNRAYLKENKSHVFLG